ncbi:thioredoxin domain-containing protein [Nonomuraea candida]|uniref:thioredoxin domain-containing protein n=1 Tax=Nonomuraea candida TaxID=359159 RepID=UPI0005B8E2DC|nr:thioredoxin family protein [Nonomuraea candida]
MNLYFFSPSCGPCKRITPKVDLAIKAGIPIRKVNVAEETGRYLAAVFGVNATPAYVEFGTTKVLTGLEVWQEF